MSDLILPPAGKPKRFNVNAAMLRKLALWFGLYLAFIMYPAFAVLRYSWGHPPTQTEIGGAALFAIFYGAFAFREMKKLTLVRGEPKK